jgi:hypothetical protein
MKLSQKTGLGLGFFENAIDQKLQTRDTENPPRIPRDATMTVTMKPRPPAGRVRATHTKDPHAKVQYSYYILV